MFYLKIFFEFCIIVIPILFSLPIDSTIFQYSLVKQYKGFIFDILIWIIPISIIGRYIIEYKIFKYKKENKKLLESVKQYRSFISGYIDDKLKDLSNKLNFNESDRITVFLYSSTLKKFYSVGRYSHSSQYNEVNRYVIDNKKEYLFSVINENNHYSKSPNINNKLWHLGKRYKRNMESNDMFGVELFDKVRQNKIGVVVFQSMNGDVYSKKKKLRNRILEEVNDLNTEINKMNIDPNTIVSHNKTLEEL